MNILPLCLLIASQSQSLEANGPVVDHPGSILIVTNSSKPKGLEDLAVSDSVEDIRKIAKKNGYDVFDKHQGIFVFEPSVLNLKELKIRCDLIQSLGKLSAVPYWLIASSQFDSPVTSEMLKCFTGDLDFTGQEKNPNAKLSVQCDFDLTITDGTKKITVKDPSRNESFKDCYFKVDPSLNHDVPKEWSIPQTFEVCPVNIDKFTVRMKNRGNDIRVRLHLLDDLNSVIQEQMAPFLRIMDEADSVIYNAFQGDEDFKIDTMTKFQDLPNGLKDRLSKYVQDHYKEFGLLNPGDSTAFLQKMQVVSAQPKLFVSASMILPNGSRKTGRVQISLGSK